jgi:hypothetical protein
MQHWKSVVLAPIHEVRYEETVADPERTARRLVAACGLDWRPEYLEFHRTVRTVRTAKSDLGASADLPIVSGPMEAIRSGTHEAVSALEIDHAAHGRN